MRAWRPTAGFPPLTADDATLARVVADAAVPAILPALTYLTGDTDLLRDDLRPDPLRMLEPDAGYDAEQLAEARALALEALRRYRDEGGVPGPPPGPEGLARLMTWLAGTDDVDDHLRLFEEELGLTGDLRAPDWTADEVAPDTDLRVAIIGAGMSGLAAAHRLRQAGVDVVVLEKNDEVGGTWFDNTYPGCRVDVPNHLYSYSFAQRLDWPEHFSTQAVLLDYFRQCADDLELRPLILFGTEVTEMAWSDDTDSWHLEPAHRGRRGDARGPGRRVRRGPAEPAPVPRHRGPRGLRRSVVPLRSVGARRRPDRQAGRRHRHGGQWRPVHPGGGRRGRRGVRVPAHPARGSSRPPTTARPCPTGSPGCSPTCPATRSGTGSGSSGGTPRACCRPPRSTPTGTTGDSR